MRIICSIFQNKTSFLFSSLNIKTGHSSDCKYSNYIKLCFDTVTQASGQRAYTVKISKQDNKLPLLSTEPEKKENPTPERCYNEGENSLLVFVKENRVSASWADQGVESEASTDAQANL